MAKKKDRIQTALHVLPGIDQPSSVSDDAVVRLKKSRPGKLTAAEFLAGIRRGDRVVLSKAITLIESIKADDQRLAQEVVELCLPYSGNSIRIGITGVPGAGKSTFIEALGTYLTHSGHHLAVLAIDPSSSRSKGSILGDKTRMEELSADLNAFIRPSPSSGTLGGVARKTWESIILCEAAGFDVVFVETVGVGQSETAAYSMVDFFLLLMLAGAGDELQGIKRGIVEMADAIVINKSDGENLRKAKAAAQEYRNALSLYPKPVSGWDPPVMTCSAMEKSGIDGIWDIILEYKDMMDGNHQFQTRRTEQSILRMHQSIREGLARDLYENKEVASLIQEYEQKIKESKISGYVAASKILEAYKR